VRKPRVKRAVCPPLQRGGKVKEAREGWEATNLIFHPYREGFSQSKFFRKFLLFLKNLEKVREELSKNLLLTMV
jgi:hypothetical protein